MLSSDSCFFQWVITEDSIEAHRTTVRAAPRFQSLKSNTDNFIGWTGDNSMREESVQAMLSIPVDQPQ